MKQLNWDVHEQQIWFAFEEILYRAVNEVCGSAKSGIINRLWGSTYHPELRDE